MRPNDYYRFNVSTDKVHFNNFFLYDIQICEDLMVPLSKGFGACYKCCGANSKSDLDSILSLIVGGPHTFNTYIH